MDYLKNPVALIFIGWLLAQGTTVFRDWAQRIRLKKNLFIELKDLAVQVDRRILSYMRLVQGSTVGVVEHSISAPINSYYFKNYYKDIFSALNHDQRLSYQLIHESIDSLNELELRLDNKAGDTINKLQSSHDRATELQLLKEWAELVKHAFVAANDTRWHIDYHLASPRNPSLDLLGPMHEAFLKHKMIIEANLTSIIEKAKLFPQSKFQQTYNPKDFNHDSPAS